MKKKVLKLILKLTISGVLLTVFLLKSDLLNIFKTIKTIPFRLLVNIGILNLIAMTIYSFRWFILIPEYSFFKLFNLNLISRFYSIVLPGQLAGEAVKAYMLGKEKKQTEMIAVSVLFDRITGVLGLLIISIMGFVLTEKVVSKSSEIIFIVIFLSILFSIILLRWQPFYLVLVNIVRMFVDNKRKISIVFKKLGKAIQACHLYANRPYLLSFNTILGTFYQFNIVVILYIISEGLNMNIPIIDWCWISGVLSAVLLIPITIGGIGLREGTLVSILGALGVSSEKSLVLSLILFSYQLLIAAFGGLILLNYQLKSINQ